MILHHNQHIGGNGYGVDVSAGAQALIERNVFDYNRHAIASSGASGTGYVARYNLVLKGGGYHDSYPVYGDAYTHQFDVHGTKYCNETLNLYHLGCGQAGEKFEFSYNAFQYTKGNAIKVRGNPTVGALVASNVFAHGSRSDAIVQNGSGGGTFPDDNISNPIEVKGNNEYGVQTYGEYGVCDLDADGKDDLFLATGVSWWYSSAGKGHWVFLNAQELRLDQVGLGDFDGDGRCDVLMARPFDFVISSGGTGDWKLLATFNYAVPPIDELAFGDFNGDGIKDIFRRASNGQWSAISPGIYDWKPLQSSSFPLSQLRFGDFNNDRITDVIAVQGGRWSVSWSGLSPWQQLNPTLSDSLKSVLIGDIDANGVDDILRYRVSANGLTGTWDISWGGTTGWMKLGDLSYQYTYEASLVKPATYIRSFIGQFDKSVGADVLALDYDRKGQLFSTGVGGFVPHGSYAH